MFTILQRGNWYLGITDKIPSIMWRKHFIKAQGYTVTHNKPYQDNKSTILLNMNGRGSSLRRTKHIDQLYFMIKNLVNRGEMTMEHDPNDKM